MQIDKVGLNHLNFNISAKKDNEDFVTNSTKTVGVTNNISNVHYKPCNVPSSYTKIPLFSEINSLPASCYKLANGQKVIIIKKDGPTLVKTYVKTGSMNEPDNLRGISHYIEHNLFNGSETINSGEFFKKTNELGATTNASTSFSQTDYYISSQNLVENDLETKIKMHADMIQYPKFSEDMLIKEKAPVISEISMVNDDVTNIAINKCLKHLYQIDSNSTDIIAGSIENIGNFSRKDVIDYYNANYSPDSMVTVIVGDVDEEKTINLVAKNFTKMSKYNQNRYNEPLAPIQKTVRTDFKSPKANLDTAVIGFAGPMAFESKDKACVDLILSLLDKDILKNMKKEYSLSDAYMVEKVGNKSNDKLAVLLSYSTLPENSEKMLKEFYKGISQIQNSEINQKLLSERKNDLKRQFDINCDYASSLNQMVGSAFLSDDILSIKNYKEIVDSITPTDIKNCAKKYFNLDAVSVVMAHPDNIEDSVINKRYKDANVSFKGVNKDRKPYNMNNISEYVLYNNAKLITNDVNSNSAGVDLLLKNDFSADSTTAKRLVCDLMFNNELNYSKNNEFNKKLHGIDISTSLNENGIHISALSAKDNLENIFYLANSLVNNFDFNEEKFNYAKDYAKKMILSQPKNPIFAIEDTMYAQNPAYQKKEQILEELETMKLEDLKSFYDKTIKNASMSVCVSAPFSKDKSLFETCNLNLNRYFQNVKPDKRSELFPYKQIKEDKFFTEKTSNSQANIIKSYKFKSSDNIDDAAKFILINAILGGSSASRLFSDLREKQKLAYKVKSKVSFDSQEGRIDLMIGTTTNSESDKSASPENVQKSIDGFDKHINLLKNELVGDEELANAKLYIKTNILDDNENILLQASDLNANEIDNGGLQRSNLLFDAIDKVTKEDIRETAKYIFSNPSVTSILADEKTVDYINSKVL